MVKGADDDEARSSAALVLSCPVEEVAVEEIGPGLFAASLLRAEEEIDLMLSEDHLQVLAKDYAPPLGEGNTLDIAQLRLLFQGRGLRVEPDAGAFEAILDAGRGGADVRGMLLAAGEPPEHGKDGEFHLDVVTELTAGTVGDDNRVDYYERGIVQSVHAGQRLGKITQATLGHPGRDVYGDYVAARDGKPINLELGDGVTLDQSTGELVATASGMVQFAKDKLSITQVFEVPGDVDFSTGNVRMEEGSVVVGGTVRAGFAVHASGNIVVKEVVEDAEIVAGGDLEVRGVEMSGKGVIKVNGSVFARFARGARIEAEGDVLIADSIVGCDIVARGAVMCLTGRGRIQGGSVRCDGGIAANVLGSSGRGSTKLTIGLPTNLERELSRELRQLEEREKALQHYLGEGNTRTILARTPSHRIEEVTERIRELVELRRRKFAAEEELSEEKTRIRRQQLWARVNGRHIYAGTEIAIGSALRVIERDIHAESQFFFDPETNLVEWLAAGKNMAPSVLPLSPVSMASLSATAPYLISDSDKSEE
jgi:uncharacterized protein (DUF342 family)